MSKYILTIDQGTTSSRVIVFDERGNIIYKVLKEFPQYYPQPGYVLHDPKQIMEDVTELILTALHEINVDYTDILGVGITNQRETTVLWDKETGEPVYEAVVWQSTQSKSICERWIEQGYQEKIQEKTGLIINPYFSASKIKWILENVPKAKELMRQKRLLFGTMDTWLIYNLTKGTHVIDYTNASRTMLFNIHTLSWDKELLEWFGIDEHILPRVVYCNQSIGKIKEERIARICELEICGVAGDQQASFIGHTCFHEGDLKITYGTGSFMLLNTGHQPVLSKHGLLSTIAYVLKDGQPCYALEGSVFVAGSAFAFIRDNLEIVKNLSDSEFKNSSHGVVFVPALTGLGAPYWNFDCRGAIYGLTRATKKSDLAWATVEGVSYLNHDVLKAMLEDTAIELTGISVDGGASLNTKLMQYQADVMQSKIHAISTSEATSLGVFYLVGLNKGLFKDLKAIKKLYKTSRTYFPNPYDLRLEEQQKQWDKAIGATLMFSGGGKSKNEI